MHTQVHGENEQKAEKRCNSVASDVNCCSFFSLLFLDSTFSRTMLLALFACSDHISNAYLVQDFWINIVFAVEHYAGSFFNIFPSYYQTCLDIWISIYRKRRKKPNEFIKAAVCCNILSALQNSWLIFEHFCYIFRFRWRWLAQRGNRENKKWCWEWVEEMKL